MPYVLPRIAPRYLMAPQWTPPPAGLQVDWSRVPRGLDTFVLFDSGQPIDVIRGAQFTKFGAPTMQSTWSGAGFNSVFANNTGWYTPIKHFTSGGSEPSSFECYIDYGSNSGIVIGVLNTNQSGGTFDHQIGIGTVTGDALFYIFDGASNVSRAGVTLTPVVHHLVGVADGSTNKIYVDGKLAHSQAASNSGFTSFTTPVFCIGQQSFDGTFIAGNSTIVILHAGFASVAWTAAEVLDRYLNPYSFLTPQTPLVPQFTAAAALQLMGQIWLA